MCFPQRRQHALLRPLVLCNILFFKMLLRGAVTLSFTHGFKQADPINAA